MALRPTLLYTRSFIGNPVSEEPELYGILEALEGQEPEIAGKGGAAE
jgi:hypothetical protein